MKRSRSPSMDTESDSLLCLFVLYIRCVYFRSEEGAQNVKAPRELFRSLLWIECIILFIFLRRCSSLVNRMVAAKLL